MLLMVERHFPDQLEPEGHLHTSTNLSIVARATVASLRADISFGNIPKVS